MPNRWWQQVTASQGLTFVKLEQVSQDQGQMSRSRQAGLWAFCLTWFGAACPTLLCPKKAPSSPPSTPPPFAFFLRTYKAWQLLGEGYAHFRGTKEFAMRSDFPAP